MRLTVITTVYNRPDFLEIQAKLLKKNIIGDYQFIAVDDSTDESITKELVSVCLNYDIFYIRKNFRGQNNTINEHHADSLNWIWQEVIKNIISDDVVLILDYDMFLIEPFDFVDWMEQSVISGVKQERPLPTDSTWTPNLENKVEYPWVGILFFNFTEMKKYIDEPNFQGGVVDSHRTDTGGNLYHFMKNNNLCLKEINVEYIDKIFDIDTFFVPFKFELYLNGKFFHYRAGSNWNGLSKQEIHYKNLIFKEILKRIGVE